MKRKSETGNQVKDYREQRTKSDGGASVAQLVAAIVDDLAQHLELFSHMLTGLLAAYGCFRSRHRSEFDAKDQQWSNFPVLSIEATFLLFPLYTLTHAFHTITQSF